MKKLTARFMIYFTVGLLLFLIYLLLMSSFLLRLISPVYVQNFVYIVDGPAAIVQHVLVILFCFLSGGALFSVFLVYPQIYIMNAIRCLSEGDYGAVGTKVLKKNGKVKLPYFLYQEIISNLVIVGRELEKAQRQREQLDKAKNEWLAGVSHDLKTPLAYVTGYSSLILNNKYAWTVEEILPHIQEIYNKSVEQEKLIEDLNLTFFLDDLETSALRLSQVELVSWLRNLMVDLANEPRGQNYPFTFDCDLDTLTAMIDENLMARAFRNLLTNALDHNPPGTEITLRLAATAGTIQMTVADNGIGLDEEAQQHIFARYYRKDQDASLHKGLGLSIVKQIMDAHQMTIAVESAPSQGTVFRITSQSS